MTISTIKLVAVKWEAAVDSCAKRLVQQLISKPLLQFCTENRADGGSFLTQSRTPVESPKSSRF